MQNTKRLLISLGALLVTACASSPQVGTDFDPGYDFSEVKRIAVMRPNATLARAGGQSAVGVNDLTAKRLEVTLEEALRLQGYELVEAEDADLIATFFVSTSDKTDVRSYNAGINYGRCYRARFCNTWGTPDVSVDQYKEGTLYLDMVSPDTHELKWRGVTSERLPSKPPSAAEREALGKEIIARILATFPPVPGTP